MENAVFNELNIRGLNVSVGNIKLSTKNDNDTYQRQNNEVDFVADSIDKRYYIQVCYAIPDAAKTAQEKRSLLGIHDSFKKIIVMKNVPRPYQDENGITIMGLEDFLLHPQNMDLI